MQLSDMITEVYSLTNRPDLVAETLSALKTATLQMHHKDFWYKDLQQATLQLQQADYVGVFDTSLLQRYRAMKFIRKWYPTGINSVTLQSTGVGGPRLTQIDPDSIFDSYARERSDVYYIAGRSVNIKTSDQLSTFLVGWYRHPDINVATYDSWIAEEHPYAIIQSAAGQVFKLIGYDEQSTRYNNLVQEQVEMLTISNTEAEVR